MNLSDRKPNVDQGIIDEVMAHLTDIRTLNEEVHDYVLEQLELEPSDRPEDLAEETQTRYWEVYALRTKEVILSALAQL